MMVDEYAVGVITYYLFSGMKDFPCKIPLSLSDDDDIYDFLEQSEIHFKQPVWESYRFAPQIKALISGLLEF